MKVALVTPYDASIPGGVAEHIAALRIELQDFGHEAVVIAPGASGGRLEEVSDGYRIGRAIAVPSNQSQARICLDPRTVPLVTEVLRRERFDVMHVHAPHTPLLPYAALLRSETANVATFHAALLNHHWIRAVRPLLAPILRRIHVRIAVSAVAQEGCRRYFGEADHIVPNGIKVGRFQIPPQMRRYPRDEIPRVLFVGRFTEPRKGFADLCQAMVHVQSAITQVRLVVVGPGDREHARAVAARAGVRNLDVIGQVTAVELPRYYASCDVVCAPSRGEESFGIVLLEAMAAGTPLVATAIPGYAAVATAGHDALLVPPRDPANLAEALITALRNAELRQRLQTAAHVTAQTYEWTNIARRVEAIYELAIQKAAHHQRSTQDH